jgi:hypothetical protein
MVRQVMDVLMKFWRRREDERIFVNIVSKSMEERIPIDWARGTII